MKKLILTSLLGVIILTFSIAETTFAEGCESDMNCVNANERCIEGQCIDPLDIMLERPGAYDESVVKTPAEAEAIANLPSITLESGFKTAMKIILGAAMILTIIAIVVAAIYYIISQGQDEDISKAKNIILYLVIGMAIMAAAYGIVTGVIQFDFFKAK